jgi:CheY-like chemotaxis protein
VLIPAIFVTAHVDESLRSRLIRGGAAACLFKPFSDKALISALHAALPADHKN